MNSESFSTVQELLDHLETTNMKVGRIEVTLLEPDIVLSRDYGYFKFVTEVEEFDDGSAMLTAYLTNPGVKWHRDFKSFEAAKEAATMLHSFMESYG